MVLFRSQESGDVEDAAGAAAAELFAACTLLVVAFVAGNYSDLQYQGAPKHLHHWKMHAAVAAGNYQAVKSVGL